MVRLPGYLLDLGTSAKLDAAGEMKLVYPPPASARLCRAQPAAGSFISVSVTMECRIGCGACCIAPSISSPIPGMPQGKPAGARCIQLTADNRCRLFGRPDRPAVCVRLRPDAEMCGQNAGQALTWLAQLEQATRPHPIFIEKGE